VQSALRLNWLFFMHVERCRSVWMGGLATVFSRFCMSVPPSRLAKETDERRRRGACRPQTGTDCFFALSSCCQVPGAWNGKVLLRFFFCWARSHEAQHGDQTARSSFTLLTQHQEP
jgi:hypothetical protein